MCENSKRWTYPMHRSDTHWPAQRPPRRSQPSTVEKNGPNRSTRNDIFISTPFGGGGSSGVDSYCDAKRFSAGISFSKTVSMDRSKHRRIVGAGLDSKRRSRLLVLFLVSVVMLSLSTIPALIRPVHAAGQLFISPASQPTLPVGSTFTVQVDVGSIELFDTWDITVHTNSSVILPISISVAGNILGSVIEVINCVNGVGTGCTISDTAYTAHSQVTSSNGLPGSGSGVLFRVTYQVVGDGYSYLSIPLTISSNQIIYQGSQVPHATSSAVYGTPPTNLPVADFGFSPADPIQGDHVTFNATNSTDPNPGATIVSYDWTFIPVSGCPATGACENVTSLPIMIHVFQTFGIQQAVFEVTLVVTDSLGLSSCTGCPTQKIVLLTVMEKALHRLAVSAMSASPQDNILAGTAVNITVTVINKGTQSETGFDVAIFLEGQVVKTYNSTDTIRRGFEDYKSFPLDTTGWQPDTYELVGTIEPSNDSSTNAFLTIRIIAPYQGALIPFTMPEFAGVVIAVLVAVGLVMMFFGRSQSRRQLRAETLS